MGEIVDEIYGADTAGPVDDERDQGQSLGIASDTVGATFAH